MPFVNFSYLEFTPFVDTNGNDINISHLGGGSMGALLKFWLIFTIPATEEYNDIPGSSNYANPGSPLPNVFSNCIWYLKPTWSCTEDFDPPLINTSAISSQGPYLRAGFPQNPLSQTMYPTIPGVYNLPAGSNLSNVNSSLLADTLRVGIFPTFSPSYPNRPTVVMQGFFFVNYDRQGFYGMPESHLKRFLFDKFDSGQKLTLTSNNHFTDANRYFACSIAMRYGNENEGYNFIRGKGKSVHQKKWYSSMHPNFSGSTHTINNFCMVLRRNDETVFNFSTYENTQVIIRWNTSPSQISTEHVMVMLIPDVPTEDGNLNIFDASKIPVRFITDHSTFTDLPFGQPLSDVALLRYNNDNYEKIIGSATAPTLIDPLTNRYEASFHVSPSELEFNKNYRLIFVFYNRDNSLSFHQHSCYSIISDEIPADDMQDICPPDVTGEIFDVVNAPDDEPQRSLGNFALVSGSERLCFLINARGDAYDACGYGRFLDNVKQVKTRIFDETGPFTNVYAEYSSIYDVNTLQWTSPQGNDVYEVVTNTQQNTVTVRLRLRVRYDSNFENLYSFNTNTGVTVPPQSNQNWVGRDLLVRTSFITDVQTPIPHQKNINFFQRIQVRAYDEDLDNLLTINFYNGQVGPALTQFCEENTETIRVEVIADPLIAQQPAKFVAGVESASYATAKLKEFESFSPLPSVLNSLQEPPVSAASPDYSGPNPSVYEGVAEALIPANNLTLGARYRFHAFWKGDPLRNGCGTVSEGSVGTMGGTFNVQGPGVLIVAAEMFSAADTICIKESETFMEDSNPALNYLFPTFNRDLSPLLYPKSMTARQIHEHSQNVFSSATNRALRWRSQNVFAVTTTTQFATIYGYGSNMIFLPICVDAERGGCLNAVDACGFPIAMEMRFSRILGNVFAIRNINQNASGTQLSFCLPRCPFTDPTPSLGGSTINIDGVPFRFLPNEADSFSINTQLRLWSGFDAVVINTGPTAGLVTVRYNVQTRSPKIGIKLSVFSLSAILANDGYMSSMRQASLTTNRPHIFTPASILNRMDTTQTNFNATDYSSASNCDFSAIDGYDPTDTSGLIDCNSYAVGTGTLSLTVDEDDAIVLVATTRPVFTYDFAPDVTLSSSPLIKRFYYTGWNPDPQANPNEPDIFPILRYTVECP